MTELNPPARVYNALCISGGGARIVQGLVLLERWQRTNAYLRPAMGFGVSGGAILTALFSAYLGYYEEEHRALWQLRKDLLEIDKRRDIFKGFLFLGLGKSGLWHARPLIALLEKLLQGKPYAFPVTVTAVKMTAAPEDQVVYWKLTGDYRQDALKIAASCAMPALVEDVGGFHDGGTLENFPLKPAVDAGANRVDLICLSAEDAIEPDLPDGKIGTALLALETMRSRLAQYDVDVNCEIRNVIARAMSYPEVRDPLRAIDPETAKKLCKYRPVDQRKHVPERNYLGVLDFDKIQKAYKEMTE